MNANTHLIHAIADALIEADGEDALDWLEGGGRAAVERGVAGWRAAIAEGAWIHRPADILVLRALRHVEHVVELEGEVRIKTRLRALVDEDRHGRRPGAKARIGEVFAHELLRGDTGEPFESIEYAWREHGEAVRGEDDEQPWDAAPPLSGAGARVEACLAEARYVERRVPFADLPGRVRQAKAMADAGDERGWTPVDEGPVFRYVRWIREDGEERMVPPELAASHRLPGRARVPSRALGGDRRGRDSAAGSRTWPRTRSRARGRATSGASARPSRSPSGASSTTSTSARAFRCRPPGE